MAIQGLIKALLKIASLVIIAVCSTLPVFANQSNEARSFACFREYSTTPIKVKIHWVYKITVWWTDADGNDRPVSYDLMSNTGDAWVYGRSYTEWEKDDENLNKFFMGMPTDQGWLSSELIRFDQRTKKFEYGSTRDTYRVYMSCVDI